VVRDEALAHDVVLVEAEVSGLHGERLERLARRQPLQPRHAHLDDEATVRLEVRGRVAKARDLTRPSSSGS